MCWVMNRVGLKYHVQIKRNQFCFAVSIEICNLSSRKWRHFTTTFNLTFEQELQSARQITDLIVIGGDWNAHHSAWLDQNTDEIGEDILDFIVLNDLHILNQMPFDCTFLKEESSSSIDITLCCSSIYQFCNDWRTDDVELDVHSDHLPITFNINTTWSSPRIERQKIETWNLRSNNWELFRQVLQNKLDTWRNNLPEIIIEYSSNISMMQWNHGQDVLLKPVK